MQEDMKLQKWCEENGLDVNNVKIIVTVYNHNFIDAIVPDDPGPTFYRDVCRNEHVTNVSSQWGEYIYIVSQVHAKRACPEPRRLQEVDECLAD